MIRWLNPFWLLRRRNALARLRPHTPKTMTPDPNVRAAIENAQRAEAAALRGFPSCYRGTIGCTYRGDSSHECPPPRDYVAEWRRLGREAA